MYATRRMPRYRQISNHPWFISHLKSHPQTKKRGVLKTWRGYKWNWWKEASRDADIAFSVGGKEERTWRQSQHWSQNVKDTWGGRGGEGEGEEEMWRGRQGAWERCEVESKTLELPWFHCERRSAETIDNACPLCQGMPKTMTSSPSSSSSSKGARTRREKPPDSTLGSLIHHDSLTYSSVSPYDQNQSHCTATDYQVFIFKKKKKIFLFLKIKWYSSPWHAVRLPLCAVAVSSLHTSIKICTLTFAYIHSYMLDVFGA